MSSEPEQLLSGAKHIIFESCAALKPEIVDTLECFKSMLRAGGFTDAEISSVMARELEVVQEYGTERKITY